MREEVASDLGIGVSTLKVWLSKHDRGRLIKIEKQAREEEEIKRLKKENRILKQEREILKKAMGIFSSMSKGKRVQEEEKLTEEVEQIFYEHKKRYGSPRIFMELKEKGVHCSEKRFANIMKKNNLVAKQRKKRKEVSSKREEAELT